MAASWLQNFLQHPELLDVYDYELSLIYAALGDRDHAFQFLTRARDRRVDQVLYAKVDPRLTSLRSDPRFGELLTSMHLQ